MRRGIVLRAALAVVALAGAALACPPGTTAGIGDIVLTPLGPVVVESCVTESGGTTTFTYEIRNEARGAIELCRFVLPGLGRFTTTSTSEPLGLALSIEDASGCATWWVWEGVSHELLPGEIATLSVSLNTAATPTTREASLALCDGTKEYVEVLAPSACAGITDDRYVGCFCGAGTTLCDASVLTEGEGVKIDMLRGSERQVLAVCSPSWVRHGIIGFDGADADRYDFQLEIDGVAIALDSRLTCVPGRTIGTAHLGAMWFVHFPADHFEAGRAYEFVGSWYDYSADPGDRLIFSRRVEVQVLPCLIPVSLLPPLPDLIIRIEEAGCDCGWTPQQAYECDVTIHVVVENQGGAPSEDAFVRVRVEGRPNLKVIPVLAPGETHAVTVKTTVATDPPGQQSQCPIEIEAFADSTEAVVESNEQNNTDTACCP